LAGIGFAVEHFFEIEAQPAQRFACLVFDAHAQYRIVQQASHQEFERQVTYPPHVVAFHRETRLCPALHDAVACREHHGLVEIRRLGAYRATAEHAAEVMREVLQDSVGRHRQTRCLQQLDIARSQ
jgi:glycine cleavage system aminomethyltransferase T